MVEVVDALQDGAERGEIEACQAFCEAKEEKDGLGDDRDWGVAGEECQAGEGDDSLKRLVAAGRTASLFVEDCGVWGDG